MPSQIRELREKRARLHREATALIPQPNQRWAAGAKEKFDRLTGEIDDAADEIRRLEAEASAAVLDRELRQTTRPPEAQPGSSGYGRPEDTQADRQYRQAFVSYMRNGLRSDGAGSRGMNAQDLELLVARNSEKRDMGVASGAGGGYLVPQGFVYELEQALKWFGGMLESSDVMDTSTGQPLPWPTDNDTTNSGEQISENTQVTKQDVTIGSLTFNAWKYSTKLILTSMELLQDSAFDIENFLIQKMAVRLGRILNTKFTVGAGTTEPNGIVTAVVANNGTPHTWGSSSGPGVPLIAAGSSTNTGGSENGTNTIGSQDLVNLEHSLDKAYRRGAKYMMSDLTLRYLKSLLDKYGRPLWLPGLAASAPDTINGYPYVVNNDMAAMATGNVTVLFGDLKKYKIRRVKELAVLRLVERFADYGQIGFLGFARYDGNLLDAGTHPVNYLKQA